MVGNARTYPFKSHFCYLSYPKQERSTTPMQCHEYYTYMIAGVEVGFIFFLFFSGLHSPRERDYHRVFSKAKIGLCSQHRKRKNVINMSPNTEAIPVQFATPGRVVSHAGIGRVSSVCGVWIHIPAGRFRAAAQVAPTWHDGPAPKRANTAPRTRPQQFRRILALNFRLCCIRLYTPRNPRRCN
jgi:hypothetical protein